MARLISRLLDLDELVLPPPPPLPEPAVPPPPAPWRQALRRVPFVVWPALLSLGLWVNVPVTVFLLIALVAWKVLSRFIVIVPPPQRRVWQRPRRAGWDRLRPDLLFDEPERLGALGEIAVLRQLARLPDDYVILHDLRVPKEANTTQLDLVVISPYGMWCLEVKAWAGRVYGQEEERHWTQVKLYAGQAVKDRRENPVAQNAYHCEALSQYLRARGHDLTVGSLVVFTEAELMTKTTSLVVPLSQVVGLVSTPGAALLTPTAVHDLACALQVLLGEPERLPEGAVAAAPQGTAVPHSHSHPSHAYSPPFISPVGRSVVPLLLKSLWCVATVIAFVFIASVFSVAVSFLTHLPFPGASPTPAVFAGIPFKQLLPTAIIMGLVLSLRVLLPGKHRRRR